MTKVLSPLTWQELDEFNVSFNYVRPKFNGRIRDLIEVMLCTGTCRAPFAERVRRSSPTNSAMQTAADMSGSAATA
jgi:hypothetical protein